MDSAAERLGRVMERIEKAARRSSRNPQDITLVAVTKTFSFEHILPFLQAGVRHIGENRVQEALSKYQNPDGSRRVAGATLHLIGQLQSNKARKAVDFFDMIQSLDRMDLAQDVNRHAQAAGRVMPCLLEVKISAETTKTGLDPEKLNDFLAQAKTLSAVSIKGLMGIAPLTKTPEEARPFFRRLRQLFEKTKLEILSMGMSADFEAAIEEGSTMVRIGTALFGSRA